MIVLLAIFLMSVYIGMKVYDYFLFKNLDKFIDSLDKRELEELYSFVKSEESREVTCQKY